MGVSGWHGRDPDHGTAGLRSAARIVPPYGGDAAPAQAGLNASPGKQLGYPLFATIVAVARRTRPDMIRTSIE